MTTILIVGLIGYGLGELWYWGMMKWSTYQLKKMLAEVKEMRNELR